MRPTKTFPVIAGGSGGGGGDEGDGNEGGNEHGLVSIKVPLLESNFHFEVK